MPTEVGKKKGKRPSAALMSELVGKQKPLAYDTVRFLLGAISFGKKCVVVTTSSIVPCN